MPNFTRAFWRLLPGVRPRERARFAFFVALCGLIGLAQTLGLAGAEALFLARYGVEWLPHTFAVGAAVTVAGSFAYGLGVGRARNDVFFIRLLLVGGALVALGFLAIARGQVWAYPALLCLWFLSQAVLFNHFWTFTWDYFDTLASKRLFPLFMIGQSLGGIAGGGIGAAASRFSAPESLLLAWASALLASALLLRVSRRPLRRWGPLELEEADETSLAAMRGAMRYVRRAPLARWLFLSTVGMVLALFTSQYLYSAAFARAFPDASQLALFLGVYLAATNVVEVVVAGALTPWLIQRFGVPSANLLHPALTLVSFVGLAFEPGLGAAVAARMNRELAENALAQPLRTLGYNALPLRFRGRVRSLLEGVILYAGMAVAGALLLATGERLSARELAGVGCATALLYLGANLVLRREYLRTLVARLREGRLDFAELGSDIGAFEATRLAALWEALLREAAARAGGASSPELEVPALLVQRGVLDPVLRAASHPDTRVRRAVITALGASSVLEAEDALRAACRDPDAQVRLAAVHGLRAQGPAAALREALGDVDPEVRAEAACGLGDEGRNALRTMVESDDRAAALAALARLPAALIGTALARASSDDAGVRAAALEAVSRLVRPVPLDSGLLTRELEHPDPRVRCAAVQALGTRDDAVASAALARALDDPARDVRRQAQQALGERGDDAVSVLLPVLAADRPHAVEAALVALSAVSTPHARSALLAELRRRVRDAWRALLALRALPTGGSLAVRSLHAAYEDAARESRRLAFRILELVEDARVMRTVDKVLRFAPPRARADALEVLANLGDRESSRLLVLMLEEGPLEEKLAALGPSLRPPLGLEDVVREARGSPDAWLRTAASLHEPEATRPSGEEERMERLLVLRQVSLFSGLSLDQLEAVSRIMSEVQYLEGELICREGDLGSELYVLVEGEVRVWKDHGTPGQILLATQTPGSYFGEMAILAEEPRSASVVASRESRLLTLEGESLKELISERPELSFELFRVLAERVRRAEARLPRPGAPDAPRDISA